MLPEPDLALPPLPAEPTLLEQESEEKRPRVSSDPLTEEDRQKLDDLVEKRVDRGQQDRVRAALNPQGVRRIIGDHREHLRSVEDALLIADRWNPRNKFAEEQFDPKTKKTTALARGNLNSLDELEQDAIFLAALNAKISTVWSISKGAVNRAEAHLSTVKAEAKKAASEAKRAGFLKGKISNQEQIDNLARTTKSVREAEEDLLNVQEQAEILGGCYYAIKDLSQVLVDRAKSLRGEWRQAVRQPG